LKTGEKNIPKQPDKSVAEGSSGRSDYHSTALQFEDNRPENAAQMKLKALTDNGMKAEGFEDRLSSAALQLKAYIGENYAKPKGALTEKAQTLVGDETIRRFKDKKELQKYAENKTSIDNAGLTDDGDWVRVDQFTVLGEIHSEKNANKLIKALGTNRFRYEGFAHLSKDRLSKDPDLAAHAAARDKARIEKLELGEREAKGRTHEAEDALPKYARTLPDVIELARQQRDGGPHQVVAGTLWPDGYSLAKALTKGLLDALMYARSFGTKFWGHSLKAFYSEYESKVDNSISVLKDAEAENKVPDFSALEIKDDLGSLQTAYETEAKSELGVSKAEKLKAFKGKLDVVGEMNVALTPEAKELDYLRDLSMFNTIKASKKKGDLLFVIGDAHRQKLQPLLTDMDAMRDKDFLEKEKRKNKAASLEINYDD
jgi:hypothetical protein